MRRTTSALSIATAVACLPSAGFTQVQAGDELAGVIELETVIVTARKRVEDPLRIPFGLQVEDANSIAERRDGSLRDVVRNVPSVNVIDNGDSRGTVFTIRGLGPLGGVPGNVDDTTVLTFVGGVPQPLYGTDAQMLDVERVEILKGPQSTLFGRNTLGGAISIIPVAPSFDRELSVRTEIGTDLDRRIELIGGGTIVPDVLAGRLAVQHQGQDPFIPNIVGNDLGAEDAFAGRASLLYQPSTDTSVTVALQAERRSEDPSYFAWAEGPNYPLVALTHADLDRDTLGGTVTVEHAFEAVTLTSISSIIDNDLTLRTDDTDALLYGELFGAPFTGFIDDPSFSDWRERERKYFQEVRLNSREGGPFDWVAGTSLYRDETSFDYVNSNIASPSINGTRDNEYRTDGVAAFAEITVPVTERLELSVGGRLAHESKDYTARYASNGFPETVPQFTSTGELDDTFWTGRVGLSYALTDDIAAYGTVSRGYKTGGFPRFTNDAYQGVAPAAYKAANSIAYEVGVKSILLDGRASLDAAVFLNDVEDEQLFAIDRSVNTFNTYNGDARSYGFELGGTIEVIPDLTLGGGFTVLSAETRNLDARVLALVNGLEDGNELVQAPSFAASASMGWRRDVQITDPFDAVLTARADYRFVGDRFADIGNLIALDAYHLVDGKVGLEFGTSEVYAYATNLLDEEYDVNGVFYGPGISTATPARGRTVGVGSLWKF